MTRDELFDKLWDKAPATKYVMGQQRMRLMVDRIVANWRTADLMPRDQPVNASLIADETLRVVGDTYGFIWMIVFQALLSFAIQALIEWWFQSAEVREVIGEWQRSSNHVA